MLWLNIPRDIYVFISALSLGDVNNLNRAIKVISKKLHSKDSYISMVCSFLILTNLSGRQDLRLYSNICKIVNQYALLTLLI